MKTVEGTNFSDDVNTDSPETQQLIHEHKKALRDGEHWNTLDQIQYLRDTGDYRHADQLKAILEKQEGIKLQITKIGIDVINQKGIRVGGIRFKEKK